MRESVIEHQGDSASEEQETRTHGVLDLSRCAGQGRPHILHLCKRVGKGLREGGESLG